MTSMSIDFFPDHLLLSALDSAQSLPCIALMLMVQLLENHAEILIVLFRHAHN